jgi:cation transport regulator
MTYQTVAELPTSIRDELPEHAQEIYRAAYNLTIEEHRAADHDEHDLQAIADQAAWQRVQMEYERDETGKWRCVSIGDYMDKGNIPHG